MKTEYIDIENTGEFLWLDFMEPLGLSQNALARAIGVPQNRISNIINGRRGITVDTDLRLCRYFKMSDGFFIAVQNDLERLKAKRKIGNQLMKIIPYANDNKTLGLREA